MLQVLFTDFHTSITNNYVHGLTCLIKIISIERERERETISKSWQSDLCFAIWLMCVYISLRIEFVVEIYYDVL